MIYALAFLMVSSIRYSTFKELDLARRQSFSRLTIIVLSLVVIIMKPVIVLSALALFYVSSGPVGTLFAWNKKKTVKRLEPAPEVETGRD